ncbi:MAG TPA: phytoene desaturase family protein [Blastocatellia bacterium]|nr:phytoene desaturase family protein [Blastocatellia bacterium]
MQTKEAVIIGGGLGGLAAGLRLVAQGWRVTICERGNRMGGKMNTWESEGFRFDTGPSLITMPWVFADLYQIAGSHLEDHVQMIPMRPLSDYSFADGTGFTYTTDLPEWLATIRNLAPGDVDGFLRLMKLGAQIYELSKNTFLQRTPLAPPRWADISTFKSLPLRNAWGNYAKVVAAHFKSPYLRQLYNRYPTYVGSSPYCSPATLLVIPYIEYAFNGWYPIGGLYRIVESLIELAQQLGITLLNDAEVEKIEHQQQRVTAVRLKQGARLPADVVVANCEAADVKTMLGREGASRLPEKDRSMSGLVFLLGVNRTMPNLQHHQIYFSADYQREFAALFDERRFPDDPTVYVNCPSRNDRSIVPGAGEALFVMANAPANDHDAWDEEEIASARQKVFACLRRNGFPAVEDAIVVEDVWTPQQLATRYAMPGGAIYGTHSHGWQKAFLRPPNKDRELQGLYYVGGSTHPGGGTPTVLLSAQITVDLIRRYELV